MPILVSLVSFVLPFATALDHEVRRLDTICADALSAAGPTPRARAAETSGGAG